MPYLVNATFFKGEINIPNAGASAAATDNINYLISLHEPKCLLEILGYPLFKLFGTETSPRMVALLSGAEYTDRNGQLAKWNGMVYGVDKSLIAYYVYAAWASSKSTVTTGTGNAVPKQNAAVAESFGDKIIYAQNRFSDLVQEMLSFLWNYEVIQGTEAFPEMNRYLYNKVKASTRKINGFGI